jgi:DNA replication protein DnaC
MQTTPNTKQDAEPSAEPTSDSDSASNLTSDVNEDPKPKIESRAGSGMVRAFTRENLQLPEMLAKRLKNITDEDRVRFKRMDDDLLRQGLTANQKKMAGIMGGRLSKMRMDDYLPDSRYPSQRFALEVCRQFVQAYKPQTEKHEQGTVLTSGICIYSPNPGVGKTHLSVALCHGLIEKNPSLKVRYLHLPDVFERLLDAQSKRGEGSEKSVQSIIDEYMRCDVVVLDDLCKERSALPPWTREKFFTLINSWWENERQLIVTTNDNPVTWGDRYGDPVASRIREMTGNMVLEVQGEDFRSRNKTVKTIFDAAADVIRSERKAGGT